MNLVCARCQQEGKPALLGEIEALDEQAEAYELCWHHRLELLGETTADRDAPAATRPLHLFIVAVAHAELRDYVARAFAGQPTVQVILDRRSGERRRVPAVAATPERRQANRRQSADVDRQLAERGWAIVRLFASPAAAPGRAPRRIA
jgi:hypothetical protein